MQECPHKPRLENLSFSFSGQAADLAFAFLPGRSGLGLGTAGPASGAPITGGGSVFSSVINSYPAVMAIGQKNIRLPFGSGGFRAGLGPDGQIVVASG